jgi:glycosyltransferase involved in cell wall biosynthesis
MNILFINSIGIRKFGGGEKWMIAAARGLHARGHRVFLAGKKGAEILTRAAAAGVPTAVLSIHADISPLATIRIARFLRRERIQILVGNLNKDIRVAGLAARLAGTPAVLHRHGVALSGKSWKHRLTMTRLTDGIITNTETVKQLYMSYGWIADPGFIKVIYNGVEPKNGIAPFDFSPLYGDKRVILSAGRLAEQKGFPYLIEAASILARRRHDFVVVIAGMGKLLERLRAQAAALGLDQVVHFAGFVEDIDSYTAGCDIAVLASLWEGMPNAVMEAMALGRPVVATSVNGVAELMVDGETGIVVPPRDAEALAEAIDRLLDNRELAAKMGSSAKRRIEERFTYARMIDQLEEHFRDCLAGKGVR